MSIDKCHTCKHAFTTGKERLYCKKSLANKDDCGEYERKAMDERVKKFRELMDGPNELKALQRELEMHLRRYGDAEVFGNMLILKDENYISREFDKLEELNDKKGGETQYERDKD